MAPPDIVSDTRRLHLWPHRSLTQRGFVWFVGLTVALIAVPLLAILGSPVLWGLLPFIGATVWAIWFALRKNGRDRDIVEDLVLSPARMTRPPRPERPAAGLGGEPALGACGLLPGRRPGAELPDPDGRPAWSRSAPSSRPRNAWRCAWT